MPKSDLAKLASLCIKLVNELGADAPNSAVVENIRQEVIKKATKAWDRMHHPLEVPSGVPLSSSSRPDENALYAAAYENAMQNNPNMKWGYQGTPAGASTSKLSAIAIVSAKRQDDMIKKSLKYGADTTLALPGYVHFQIFVLFLVFQCLFLHHHHHES